MLLSLLFLGLIGALSFEAAPIVIRRRDSSMGEVSDNDKQKTENVERYLVQTMRLTDPNEVAKRARRLEPRYPKTAHIVMRRARELKLSEDSATASPLPLYQSLKLREPQKVFNLRWTKFILSMVRNDSDVSPTNHLGYFLFAYPRLVALKLAKNLRKEDKDGKKVWTADLIEPFNLEGFLASSKAQYDVFVKSVLEYLPALQADRFTSFIGKPAEGKKITLSGQLAIAHRAGIDGLKSWLAHPEERAKYKNTTDSFLKSTEIF